jgi:flagellar secretion chaperone FliS
VNKAIAQYQQLKVASVVDSANPHELVDMLFAGACARLQKASGCVTHGDIEGRNKAINETLSILTGLQASLDHARGGDLAENLDALYDYMQRRLLRANADADVSILREVIDLLTTLREAWLAIGQELPRVEHA